MNLAQEVLHKLQLTRPLESTTEKLWSSSIWDFFKYILIRNRGYGQRKILNLTHDGMEILLLGLMIDINYFFGLILIPLFHFFINYLQEFYYNIIRLSTLEESRLDKKKLDIVFISMVILSGLIFGAAILKIYPDSHFPLILFAIRALAIIGQVVSVIKTVSISVERRVRVNPGVLWSLSFLGWVWATVLAIQGQSLEQVLIISAIFCFLRLSQEGVFFWAVYQFKKSVLSHLVKKESSTRKDKKDLGYLLANFILTLTLLFFLAKYLSQEEGISLESLFFVIGLTLLDRFILRPFRSLQVDYVYLAKNGYYEFKQFLTKRLSLMTFLLILGIIGSKIYWGESISLQEVIISLFVIRSSIYTILLITGEYGRYLKFYFYSGILLLITLIIQNDMLILLSELIFILGVLKGNKQNIETKKISVHDFSLMYEKNPTEQVLLIETNGDLPKFYLHFDKFLEDHRVTSIRLGKNRYVLFNADASLEREIKINFAIHLNQIHSKTLKEITELLPPLETNGSRVEYHRLFGWSSKGVKISNQLSKALFRRRSSLREEAFNREYLKSIPVGSHLIYPGDLRGDVFYVHDQPVERKS